MECFLFLFEESRDIPERKNIVLKEYFEKMLGTPLNRLSDPWVSSSPTLRTSSLKDVNIELTSQSLSLRSEGTTGSVILWQT